MKCIKEQCPAYQEHEFKWSYYVCQYDDIGRLKEKEYKCKIDDVISEAEIRVKELKEFKRYIQNKAE